MNKQKIEEVKNRAVKKFPEFWLAKKELLNCVTEDILKEFAQFRDSYDSNLTFLKKEAENFVAIWSISGSGSLTDDLIDVPSDHLFKKYSWYRGTDRDRLQYSSKIIQEISNVKADLKTKSSIKNQELIQKYGPKLIYNGVGEQVGVLLQEAGKTFDIPLENIFIPPGKVTKTIDQVINFSMPGRLKKQAGGLGIVSHGPHLSRVLRFINRNKDRFSKLQIIVFPLFFREEAANEEFLEFELSGILDYIAKGEADPYPFPYQLKKRNI